ncbi:uncharacterized protein LOC132550806 [Ylistrum balloti]|uniref:uncharacterized protein LOC132550806 n=1 Tax=Ylistrum balloti TaxID=509963 RepID=UPI002905E8DA|nr:uncharacterized protein LOC132550806 [Ylistrum balloti]
MGETAAFCCCFLFTFFAAFLLQAIGFFSPYWVKWKECDAQGLFTFSTSNSANECVKNGEYISPAALGLQASSLTIYLMFWTILCCIGKDKDEEFDCYKLYGGCFILLYPIAGILSIAGCVVMGNIDVSEFSFGWSYILCLTSGIYVIMPVVVACGCICKAMKESDENVSSPQQTPTTIATTGASGQLNLRYGGQDRHVAVAVTEREELAMSNGIMVLRKMRIMQVVGLVR